MAVNERGSPSLLPRASLETALLRCLERGAFLIMSCRPSSHRLWSPSPERIERARITRFARERGLPTEYEELWRWSVDHLEDFWAAIWDEFGVDGSYDAVLASRDMPGAQWFPGARVN